MNNNKMVNSQNLNIGMSRYVLTKVLIKKAKQEEIIYLDPKGKYEKIKDYSINDDIDYLNFRIN